MWETTEVDSKNSRQNARKLEWERRTKRNGRIIKLVLAVLVVIILFISSFYTVSESEAAVVERMGAYQSTESAGPHFRMPFFENVRKVNMANRIMVVGFDPETDSFIISESKMITGDVNITNIDFYVTWKVSDPYKFLYHASDPEAILGSVVQSSARSVTGSQKIDDVLTSGKLQIQSDIKSRVFEALNELDLGITLVELVIQDAEPADNEYGEVSAAFKDVETAKQNQEQMENEGRLYQNKQVPLAQAEADKIIRTAEAYKAARIAQANGEVAEFVAMYEEYIKNPAVVEKRMYYETIEKVFPELTLYVDTSNSESNILKLLQLGTTTEGN